MSSYALQALRHDGPCLSIVADAECITVASGGDRLYQKTLLKSGDGAIDNTGLFDTS